MPSNENIAQLINQALTEKAKHGFLTATDIMEMVSSLDMQAQFLEARIDQPLISRAWCAIA